MIRQCGVRVFFHPKSHLKRNKGGRLDVKGLSLTWINMDGAMVNLCLCVIIRVCLCVFLCAVLIGRFILINNVFMPECLLSVLACFCVSVFWYVMPFVLCVFLCVGCAAHPVAVPVAGTAPGLDPYQHAPAQTEWVTNILCNPLYIIS